MTLCPLSDVGDLMSFATDLLRHASIGMEISSAWDILSFLRFLSWVLSCLATFHEEEDLTMLSESMHMHCWLFTAVPSWHDIHRLSAGIMPADNDIMIVSILRISVTVLRQCMFQNPVYVIGVMARSSSFTLSLTSRVSMKSAMVSWVMPAPVRVSALRVS